MILLLLLACVLLGHSVSWHKQCKVRRPVRLPKRSAGIEIAEELCPRKKEVALKPQPRPAAERRVLVETATPQAPSAASPLLTGQR